jgi:thiol:disulfide interchange protein
MRTITRFAALTVGALALVGTSLATPLEGWSTDLEAAFEKAKETKMPVLVEFTGSDWCPPCKAMRKNVFSKKEFVDKASEKFILVELDFPRGNPEVKKKNQPYAKKYEIRGYPTVILFDSNGEEFDRFFASKYPTVEKFLAHLDAALDGKDML